MTIEDAIEAIKCNWPDSRYTILREALDMAISTLRQQDHFREVTKKVEPLTLGELRQMVGQPVYVTHRDGSGGRWGIVNLYAAGLCADVQSGMAYWFNDYTGTIAYRQKPEEDDHA